MKRIKLFAIISALLLLMLSGCGDAEIKKISSSADSLEFIYENGYYVSEKLLIVDEPYINSFAVGADKLAFCCKDAGSKYVIYSYEPVSGKTEELFELKMPYFVGMDLAPSGDICVLSADDSGAYELTRINADGHAETMAIEADIDRQSETLSSVHALKNGYLLYGDNVVIAVDSEGTKIKRLSFPDGSLSIVRNSEFDAIVAVSGDKGTRLYFLDEKLNTAEAFELSESYSRFFDSKDSAVYAQSASVIFSLDCKSGKRTGLINTALSEMAGSEICIQSAELIYSNAGGSLTKWLPAEGMELKTIELATYNTPFYLFMAVSLYNQSSADCKINIVDYAVYDNATMQNNGLNKLHLDIVSGDAPDIFDLSNVYPNFYSSKGVLEDLTAYFEADSSVSLDDLSPALVKLLKYRGGIYELVPYYNIVTMAADERTADAEGFTPEKFFELTEQYELTSLLGKSISKTELLDYCLMFDHSLVNYESAECNFQSPDFIKLLELSAKLPSEEDKAPDHDSYAAVCDGEQLMMITNLTTWPIPEICFLDTIFGGDVSFSGFPANEGSGVIIQPGLRLGMSSDSENKSEVWDFFAFLLSEVNQTDLKNFPGLPAVQSALRAKMDKWEAPYSESAPTLSVSSKGEYFHIEGRAPDALTEGKLSSLIERMDGFAVLDTDIAGIVHEEAMAYYSGDKSAEEAARQIQQRASLYMAEQYG